MSTFSGISVAWTGLTAARAGMDTVGQNIANAATEGYTRQRVSTSALPGLTSSQVAGRVGQGVSVTGIARLGDALAESRVSTASAQSGFASLTAKVHSAIELNLHEPGDTGLSAALADFWSAWQNMANKGGDAAAGGVLLQSANALTGRIADGYSGATGLFTQTRNDVTATVTEINTVARQVADLNATIRQTTAAGGNANELLDQRSVLTAQLATLAGANVVLQTDGTATVFVGGNALVEGKKTHELVVSGAQRLEDVAGSPVAVTWAETPTVPVSASSGRLAAGLAALAPGGGPIVSAAQAFNSMATTVASAVNAIHQTGATSAGTTGLNFFSFDSAFPAALGLRVVPTDVTAIAAGIPGAGAGSGGTADKIAALGTSATGPGADWADHVIAVGIATKRALDQDSVAGSALSSASSQLSAATAVDLDEETANLLTFQHAYQGAARVLTAIDEMLDVLINRTGLVGR